MPDKIISIYCFFDELLQAMNHRDDKQARISTAEIMTVAVVAAEFFTGNQQAALEMLTSHGYIKALSKSRLNRRLHQIPESLWQVASFVLAQARQQANPNNVFIVDTFPVPVCRNIRIKRCKIYKAPAKGTAKHRGWCASKKEYFYGLKVCMIVTEAGHPIEFSLVPGATADITALKNMEVNLPEGSTLFGDGGFLDLAFETELKDEAGIELIVPRRKNMKEQLDACTAYVCRVVRKQVETTFSQLTERMARSIHAVTPRGFELKIMLTNLAFSLVG